MANIHSKYVDELEDDSDLNVGFQSYLNLLKEHIKTASFSRGFKIDVHSNFYKLL